MHCSGKLWQLEIDPETLVERALALKIVLRQVVLGIQVVVEGGALCD
jgi:hypothetical protein